MVFFDWADSGCYRLRFRLEYFLVPGGFIPSRWRGNIRCAPRSPRRGSREALCAAARCLPNCGRQASIASRKTCVLPDRSRGLLFTGSRWCKRETVEEAVWIIFVLITTRILDAPQQNYKDGNNWCRWMCTPINMLWLDIILFTSAYKNPLQIVCRRFGEFDKNELIVIMRRSTEVQLGHIYRVVKITFVKKKSSVSRFTANNKVVSRFTKNRVV